MGVMSKFTLREVFIVFTAICICLGSYSIGYQNGKDNGFDEGYSAARYSYRTLVYSWVQDPAAWETIGITLRMNPELHFITSDPKSYFHRFKSKDTEIGISKY